MSARQNQEANSDIVAGALLISIGTLALVVRLGLLTITQVPQEVLQWWPLLLIIVGVGLWATEHPCRLEQHPQREAKYVK